MSRIDRGIVAGLYTARGNNYTAAQQYNHIAAAIERDAVKARE